MGSRIVATGRATPRTLNHQSGPRTPDGHVRRMDSHAHRHRPALRDEQRRIAGRNRRAGERRSPGSRRSKADRSRRDHRRYGLVGLRLSLVRLPVAASAGDRLDSGVRRRRGLLGLRLCLDASATPRCARATGRRVLVVGADALSTMVDWGDRATAVLFGDGAGAAVLVSENGPRGVLGSLLRSSGAYWDLLSVRIAACRTRWTPRRAAPAKTRSR